MTMTTTEERKLDLRDRGLLARFAYEAIPAWVQGVRAKQAIGKQQAASGKAWRAREAKREQVLQAMKGPEGRWVDQLIWPN